jgi:outer membrane protein assembly factor BamB
LTGDYLAVLKQDYDAKTLYMLSSRTGEVLWRTDPKDGKTPAATYSIVNTGEKLLGIQPHPGQAFRFVAIDNKTGKTLYRATVKGYKGPPEAVLVPRMHGNHAVALVKDRQDFEVRAFDVKDGKEVARLGVKSAGNFGVHGQVSATAQNGSLALLGKNRLILGTNK